MHTSSRTPLLQIHLVGFSWALADEGKMQSTFGLGAKDFGQFTDLQRVAQGLGYHGFGLARLTRQVVWHDVFV